MVRNGGLIMDCCTRQWHHYMGENCMICGQLLAKILLKWSDVVVVVVLFWIAAPCSGTITWSRIPNEDHQTNIRRENLKTYDTMGM
jgi:uncharacterized membrane protein